MSTSSPPPGDGRPVQRSARDTWWPAVTTLEQAQGTARRGFWAAVINICLTTLLLVLSLVGGEFRGQPLGGGVSILTAVELCLFFPFASGLWFFNRWAAAGALVAYVASEIIGWTVLGLRPDIFSMLLFLCFLLFFVHGVRGCFAVEGFYIREPDIRPPRKLFKRRS